jgi:hypothetical protein
VFAIFAHGKVNEAYFRSDRYCEKILKHLKDAARPDTKLIIVDNVLSYACRFPSDDADSVIPGSTPKEAPEPLLANYGVSSGLTYLSDLTVRVASHTRSWLLLTRCNR